MSAAMSDLATTQRPMTNAVRRVFMVIATLAAAGIVVSSISLRHHYGTSATSYCDFGENFNCDIVNRSSYSTVLGVPDALIGILGYAVLLALATAYRAKAEAPAMLLLACVAGLSFALYLTYIEAFVLATWCILCLSSLTLIVLITGLSSFLVASAMRRS
ncbi:MAG TPA: vitamin K epoxide reductase family protein [Terriglobales bacterium]|nr:vitamin K epoxide reductase family protein [Terriglobales bacterium]